MAALLTPSHAGTDHTYSTVMSDYFAQSGTGSTALTSPSLYPSSPLHKQQHLTNIDEERLSRNLAPPMQYAHDSIDESLYADDPPDDPAAASPPQDVRRGPSVKSRASTYEQSLGGHSVDRPISRAASPFRLPPSPGGHSLHAPASSQQRPHSPGRSRSPMRLPVSPGPGSHYSAPRSHSPGQHSSGRNSPRPLAHQSTSSLRLPEAHSYRSSSPLAASPKSHHSGLSSRELPHSPCGTMPTSPYERELTTPSHRKRVPVPSSAPAPMNLSPSPQLPRGTARNMIAQWETGPLELQSTPPRGKSMAAPSTAPAPATMYPASSSPQRHMSQAYLDDKPLPIPTATAIPASASMPWPPPNSSRLPNGGPQMPAPLRDQRSPMSKAEPTASPSRSSLQLRKRAEEWASLSPGKSPHKSPMKRSPFKDIVNKLTGRKKDGEPTLGTSGGLLGSQSRQFISLDNDDNGWFAQPHPGLNDNAVFSDRMGDDEMFRTQDSVDAVRSSAVLFLSPTPVSSVTQWGSWLTAWATLTPRTMSITYAPTVPGESPQNVAAYASIPKPSPDSRPEVEFDMRDCVEVRSLRPAEVRGRGIPSVPEGGGSEVLEIAFSHGLKRYVAVEGVTGRLGWVSAIWDVLLACKQEPGANMAIPPPSPSIAAWSSNLIVLPQGSHDSPVQRYGDTWVAAGELPASDSRGGTPVRSLPPTPKIEQLHLIDAEFPPRSMPFDIRPGEVVPSGLGSVGGRSGISSSPVPPTAAVLNSYSADTQGSRGSRDLPPIPPAKDRPRSAFVSERIKAWTAEETATTGSRPLPVPIDMETVASVPTVPESTSGSGDGTADESRFSSTRSGDNSLGTSSGATFATATNTSVPLRKALVQMFDAAAADENVAASRKSRSVIMEERIRAWQPSATETSPPLSRMSTTRQADSLISVDPSDLNPSRSASQVRPRPDSTAGIDMDAVDAGLRRELPSVEEAASSPRERSFGPRAPKVASPAVSPAVVRGVWPPPVKSSDTRSASSSSPTELKPPAADSARAASPVTTPRLNARLLAAAAVFEPTIAERASAPSSAVKRMAIPSAFRTETPEPLTRSIPRSEPKSDSEAISEIQSIRSGLRSVKQELASGSPIASPRLTTAPLNLRRYRAESSATDMNKPSIQRATSSTSTTSEVTSVTPIAESAISKEVSSTVEAVESSIPPSRMAPSAVMPEVSTALPEVPVDRTSMVGRSPALDEQLHERLDTHSAEHGALSQQLNDVRTDMTAVAVSVGGLGALLHSKEERDAALPELLTSRLDILDSSVRDVQGSVNGIANVPPAFTQRFDTLGSDLRNIQIVLHETSAHVAALAVKQASEDDEKELPPPPPEASEPQLPEIHAKLDALAHLIQELLQRQGDLAAETAALAAAGGAAGAAVAERGMPADGNPVPDEPPSPAVEPATAEQLDVITGMVSQLEAERALQAQQTADIAKYLGDLNGWLEKFVHKSGGELESMSQRLDGMAGDSVLVPEIHGMLAQQLARPVGESGVQSQRVDALVGMMAEERERQQQQVNVVEHVIGLLDKQRQDNENLLRAVATDLTSEIRGERVKFIDAMQQATSMNMQIHVDEFKKALTNEVSLSMRELGELREQKKVLQHQIADLFSLMAKHGEENRAPPGMFPPSPGPARVLPMPPH